MLNYGSEMLSNTIESETGRREKAVPRAATDYVRQLKIVIFVAVSLFNFAKSQKFI